MRVVVANSPIHFGLQWHSGNFFARAAKANDHVGQFFTHRGGTGRLPMRSAEHGHRCIGMGHAAKLLDDFFQRGQDHLMARTF